MRHLLRAAIAANQAPLSAVAEDAIKVGIIGNSHMAALRLAVTTEPARFRDMHMSFWGMPGSDMAELARVDAHGVVSAVGGKSRALEKLTGDANAKFDPGDFDVVIVYGYSLGMATFFRKFASLVEGSNISSAMREDVLTDDLMQRFGFQYASTIQGLGRKVILHASPFTLEGIDRSSQTATHIPDAVEYAIRIARSVGARFYIQPSDTIVGGFSTAAVFQAARGDTRHMNAAYGTMVLDNLGDFIRQ